jgi:hypothetical protein
MTAILDWFADIWVFLRYWLEESFKEAAKWGTSLWGLAVIITTLVWTVFSHIIPILGSLLDTLNGLVTGDWNYTPPAILSQVLAIGNTLCPLDELITYAAAYGTLKAGLALFRFVKNLIPTEAGT